MPNKNIYLEVRGGALTETRCSSQSVLALYMSIHCTVLCHHLYFTAFEDIQANDVKDGDIRKVGHSNHTKLAFLIQNNPILANSHSLIDVCLRKTHSLSFVLFNKCTPIQYSYYCTSQYSTSQFDISK